MQCNLAAQVQTLHMLLNSSYTAAISYQHRVLLIIRRVMGRMRAESELISTFLVHVMGLILSEINRMKSSDWNLSHDRIRLITFYASFYSLSYFILGICLLWFMQPCPHCYSAGYTASCCDMKYWKIKEIAILIEVSMVSWCARVVGEEGYIFRYSS